MRIGRGQFGDVIKVIDKNDNNKLYALKFIGKRNDCNIDTLKEEYEKEIEIMKIIKNEYIVELKDYFYDESNEGYCIVMELCDGNLRDILKKYKPKGLLIDLIKKIFIQLNDGLKAMINKGYFHRDLKPENILIKYSDSNKINFNIKLTDFGLSTNELNSSINPHSNAGTKIYSSS